MSVSKQIMYSKINIQKLKSKTQLCMQLLQKKKKKEEKLSSNVIKYVQDVFSENGKMLMTEMTDDRN